MSDEEEYSEEEEEEEAPAPAPASSGPTEAELAMQKRRDEMTHGSNEDYSDVLAQGQLERDAMEEEIQLLRERREQRKKERVREEKEIQAKRQEEEASRKQEEVERKRQKEEAENERKAKRDDQMKEFAKMQDTKANFVIIKKSNELVGGPQEDDKEEGGDSNKMSREQEMQERKAILGQRIVPLEIDGFDEAKLKSKAENLHGLILRLEGEKYDLEKRFREQQQDMLEMAERARNINKVGKTGLKRVVLKDDERDTIQERFSGAPSKIELYSRFERQPDKRVYNEKHTVFVGPTYLFPADKIVPTKLIKWDENSGLPTYTGLDGKELAEEEE